MTKEIMLVLLLLFFGSVRCEAESFAPLPQAFPVDSSVAFPVLQQNPLTFRPNFCNVKGSTLVGDKCILVEQTPLTWHESKRYCSQIGFKLLEIVGGEDYFTLISYLRAKGFLSNSYWIGATNQFNRVWTWISRGLPVHSTFWAVTFLNGKGVKEPISTYASNDCAVLSKSRSHFIKAEQCLARNCFICEKPLNIKPSILPQPNPWFSHPQFPHFLQGSDDVDSCPSGFVYIENQDKCFALITDPSVSFSGAKDDCENKNATLVTITSEEENDDLLVLFHTDPGTLVYIGLFSDAAGIFQWLSGVPVSYTNWGSGQPGVPSMSCGSFDLSTGEWFAGSCQEPQGYICEADADIPPSE